MCYKLKFVVWLIMSQLLINTFVCKNIPQNTTTTTTTHKIEKRNVIVVARALNSVRHPIWKLFGFTVATSTNKIINVFDEVSQEISKMLEEENDRETNTASIQQNNSTILRSSPRFAKMQQSKNRSVRSVGLNTVGRYAGWTLAMIMAGAATSSIDTAMKEKSHLKTLDLVKKTFTCDKNNFGCVANVCWTNCGPRLDAADWCLTMKTKETKTSKNNTSTSIEFASCERDADCNPCWPCGGSCILENRP